MQNFGWLPHKFLHFFKIFFWKMRTFLFLRRLTCSAEGIRVSVCFPTSTKFRKKMIIMQNKARQGRPASKQSRPASQPVSQTVSPSARQSDCQAKPNKFQKRAQCSLGGRWQGLAATFSVIIRGLLKLRIRQLIIIQTEVNVGLLLLPISLRVNLVDSVCGSMRDWLIWGGKTMGTQYGQEGQAGGTQLGASEH